VWLCYLPGRHSHPQGVSALPKAENIALQTLARDTIKEMKKILLALFSLLALAILVLIIAYAPHFAVLNPKGLIAEKERNLIMLSLGLMLIVVVPVLIMTFAFAWKYRADNVKATYTPDWDNNTALEAVWWAVPCLIIAVLAVVTWKSSHELDPYQPVYAANKAITVQVVALDWKWLFIYPEQHIATVNYLQFPAGTPINFQISSDAPMNSFWIPQLGGQVYAMPGMSTQLHLIANEVGNYAGSSSNISGRGFAGMRFTAHASSQADFDAWVADIQKAPSVLTGKNYQELAKPSENNPVASYSVAEDLYNEVVMKYMAPMPGMRHLNSIAQ
jgi:cytochrome o ubiquinol oxidase subunit 2